MSSNNVVHVAVAVIKNSLGQYFIAKRPEESHQGGLWEFPGGKVENDESVLDALKRELFEEVGIVFVKANPLIKIHHNYTDKTVLLDVFLIDDFSGKAFGKEGQEVCWINENEFSCYKFPVANIPIIKAIMLPDKYMITGMFSSEEELLRISSSSIKNGIMLIQFRAPQLEEDVYFKYAKSLYSLCEDNNVTLLLNTSADRYINHLAHKYSHGIHLNSNEIKLYAPNQFSEELLISTSTHNQSEITLAEEKNVSFIVLSPVAKTLSHPDSPPLGWGKFKQLVEKSKLPVFALGGMTLKDLDKAKNSGAQGIAAIGEFWNE